MCEQLKLILMKKINYSSELIVFSSLLYYSSPKSYYFLKSFGNLILPSNSTVRRLTYIMKSSPEIEQSDVYFLHYIKEKFRFLNPNDKIVTLMIDEIHMKKYFDYKGGTIVGAGYNTDEAASSAFVFMLNSLKSSFKDVVHILPVKTITAEALYQFIHKIVVGLENIGFMVICIVTDNNAINSKAMSSFVNPPKVSFVYPHPSNTDRPLFFLFDSVHIFKCVRNNWLNQKNTEKNMIFPNFDLNCKYKNFTSICKAPFTTLYELHKLEINHVLKYSYNLSLKALYPSNFERQNVKLVMQIFNDYVSTSLKTLGDKINLTNSKDVALFIDIITRWWEIMNVKTPFKGQRLNNNYQYPLTCDFGDIKIIFLNYFFGLVR